MKFLYGTAQQSEKRSLLNRIENYFYFYCGKLSHSIIICSVKDTNNSATAIAYAFTLQSGQLFLFFNIAFGILKLKNQRPYSMFLTNKKIH